jgi:heptaprenyl diphosphate synthase
VSNPQLAIEGLDPLLAADLSQGLAQVEELLSTHIQGDYPLVEETSRHLVLAGGKRLRPLLVLLTSHLGPERGSNIFKAAVACELTHLGTLYHDDVMDEAALRRGVTSANYRWGNAVAILTGDYLFAKTSALLAEVGPEAVLLQALTFERLVIGQIQETQGPLESEDPMAHYMKVVANKTASLISTSARFGAMLSGADPRITETVTEFGELIGIAFQLADDILDIASESAQSGKTPGTDLKEGIPTLVTLLARASDDPADVDLKEILSKPIHDEDLLQQTLSRLREHKAMDQAREMLAETAARAVRLLDDLPENSVKQALLGVISAVIHRSA